MIYPTVNNYYIRDDGLLILIENIGMTTFQFKVILPSESYRVGGPYFEFTSNIYDYKPIDYKWGKRFDQLITQ